MSEPTDLPASSPSKRRRSARRQAAETGEQAAPRQTPPSDHPEEWKQYWTEQGQPWRTEPEIALHRQQYLLERQALQPDHEQGLYPFKDIPLNRADVEWLLANHAGGRWVEESLMVTRDYSWPQMGPDLRGADLRGVDLHWLPLMRLYGGLRTTDWLRYSDLHHHEAAIHLTGASLYSTHLEQARLRGAHLEGANLRGAHLQGARLTEAHLEGALLTEAFFDEATNLDQVAFAGGKQQAAFLLDVHWGGVNLSAVNWSAVTMLGEEQVAHQRHNRDGKKSKTTRLIEYSNAVRANRQLATVLREQGLHEIADRFAFRAQLCQREVLRRQGKWLNYMGSWLLWLLAGYGYRPLRAVLIYLFTILGFATGYFAVTHTLHTQTAPLAWYEAMVLSVSSFHGRGFFQPVQSLGDPIAILASLEAVCGLLIEVSFIATFTQRFFGR